MVIGITGGIGSGKSTVCKLIECLGYKVYYSDSRATSLMESHQEIIKEIKSLFSNHIYDQDGKLNRKQLASEVFANRDKLRQLETIVHPRVMEDLQHFICAHQSEIVFVESAIMFESKLDRLTDLVITISAPVELRIKRVINRDNSTLDNVRGRISAQMSDCQREELSQYTIVCDDHKCVTTQLLDILRDVSI